MCGCGGRGPLGICDHIGSQHWTRIEQGEEAEAQSQTGLTGRVLSDADIERQ